MRGGRRHNNGGHHGGGGGGQHQHNRRVNPRIQTFDSNGPEVRIRGNAFQITEKYMTLARDAAAGGDRVLAESYFQHAEHYQRMINEANEETARYQAQYQAQQPQQPYDAAAANGVADGAADNGGSGIQPAAPVENLNDLDQGFLVGGRQKTSDAS